MMQEEKDLVFKDLCSRLPYNCIVSIAEGGIYGIQWDDATLNSYLLLQIKEEDAWEYVKPYLRPMNSMTEDEYNDMYNELYLSQKEFYTNCGNTDYIGKYIRLIANDTVNDWLNKNMFDYRGLIKRGLALEAPEGMYDS